MTTHTGKKVDSFRVPHSEREGKSLTEVLASMNTTSSEEKVIPMIVTVPMLTLKHNAVRNGSVNLCGVEVYFDAQGEGKTPSSNREYVEQYQRVRQGFVTIVSDDTIGPDLDEVDPDIVAILQKELEDSRQQVLEEVARLDPELAAALESNPLETSEDDNSENSEETAEDPALNVKRRGRPKKS